MDHTIAAMCLWEAVVSRHGELQPRTAQLLDEKFQEKGTCGMREEIEAITYQCHREYEALRSINAYDEPFDWEWVPAWLDEFYGYPDRSPLERVSSVCLRLQP